MPILLILILVPLLLALVIGIGLGVIFLIWKLYLFVIPYFFGAFVPSPNMPGYVFIHPAFWPFLGLMVLIPLLFAIFLLRPMLTFSKNK